MTELAVESMAVEESGIPRYIASVLARLQEVWVGAQIADIKSRLRRMAPATIRTATTRCSVTSSPRSPQYRRSLLEQD